MSSSPNKISIRPAQPADLFTLAHISYLAMLTDRHTQFKSLDPVNPLKHEPEGMQVAWKHWMRKPKGEAKIVKAVAVDEKGKEEIVGWVCWGARGMAPWEGGEEDGVSWGLTVEEAEEEEKERRNKEKEAKQQSVDGKAETSPPPSSSSVRTRLESYTSADLQSWMAHFMPSGTRCMYIIGISVHPDYQGKGVGSALIRHGTERADQEGVFCWVHSSVAGVKAFEKQGFGVVGKCVIDMDEWNEGGVIRPPVGEENWGIYVLRYLRREPSGVVVMEC